MLRAMLRSAALGCLVWSLGWMAWAPAGAAPARGDPDHGEVLLGAVVLRVVDGDSLWVRPRGGAPLRLRLAGVDAPEICQRHGREARDALATRLQGKKVRVTLQHKDTYDRWLARIDGPDGDVGAWLVGRGHAWSMRWQNNPGPYAVQESAARKSRRGLFSEPRPEPPRDFRRRHGPCQAGGAPHTAQPG
jgi:micrococcal nuclease